MHATTASTTSWKRTSGASTLSQSSWTARTPWISSTLILRRGEFGCCCYTLPLTVSHLFDSNFYEALCLIDIYRATLCRLKNLEEEEARLEATGAYAPEEDDEGTATPASQFLLHYAFSMNLTLYISQHTLLTRTATYR